MKRSFKTIGSLTAALLFVLLVMALTFLSFKQIKLSGEARKHTFIVLSRAEELLSAIKDAETGQRGFLLTGDDTFLQPYEAVNDSINGLLINLRKLTDIDTARQHLDTMTPLVEAKLADMAQIIALRRTHSMAAVTATVGLGQGKRLMDSIRAEMRSVIQLEENALKQHDAEFHAKMLRMYIAIVVASLLTLLLALAFAYMLYREAQQRHKNLLHLETERLLEVEKGLNTELQRSQHELEVQQIEIETQNDALRLAREEAKELETVLRTSEELLAVTLNSIGDAVITTDARARVARLNPIAEQLTGWTQAEAAGLPIDAIFHIINKGNRQPAPIPVMDAIEHGTIQDLANHTVLIAKDGSEYDIADSCAPIRNRDDKVIGAVLVFRDVSEEYAVQQAMRDNSALMRAILNTVVDGIITINAVGGLVETVNPAAELMFGYSATELEGQNFGLLIPELDQEQRSGSLEYYSASAEALVSGHGREVTGKRQDGSSFPLELALSEMDLGGQRYFTGILRDNTARKQVEAERVRLEQVLQDKNSELESAKSVAEKANQAKSDFLSSMSHELRTPLSAILGFAQLLESGTPSPVPTQKRSIDQILKAGWYLLELINEILDLAVIESGKLSMSLEPVSLLEIIYECEAMIEPQAKKRGISVKFIQLTTACFVKADRTRVKQVLINLLSNAIKYNRVGGSVVVESVLNGTDSVRISVTDTGEGLTPEQQTKLFQPFNRLGQEANAEQGTGIGLVVCKRLVEWMGGVIGVESTVGKGSVFWVELNLTTERQTTIHSDNSIETTVTQAQGDEPAYTLLYVEDNPANLMLVEDIIARRPDIRLLSTMDGKSGIELARVSLPDVILMDIHLPGISGIDAMKILVADAATAHIPVIALSANAIPRDIEKGLEAGFFRYLTKPIKVSEFMNTLDIALKFAKKDQP